MKCSSPDPTAARGAADAIAVIGLSLRFPDDANSVQGFWDMMMEKRCASKMFPQDRIKLEGLYHPDSTRHDTIALKGGHFLGEDVTVFDAPFFSISASEAASMDPQQRHLLEVSYLALENAGIPMQQVAGSNTSVFTGCFTDDYKTIYHRDVDCNAPYAATGITTTLNANRVSWFFNTQGISVNIDTACSSSLVALDLACQNLRTRESDMSLVSGANLILTPDLFFILSDMNMLSTDSRCWSFDERANGYARGEGVAVLVLKRLSDAVRDGDTIRAVITSTASNHDGFTPGITQPSQRSQEVLIRHCYAKAGLDLSRTALCEAHGTGTPVGDPIEANAIGNVFRQGRAPDNPLYVGAVKSNIGHLEGACGVAGVIKTILALEKAIIPPNANLDLVNSKIDEQHLRIKFPRAAIPWPRRGLRRASVNSFGFGGANAHAVVDDALHFLLEHGLGGNHNTVPEPPLLEDVLDPLPLDVDRAWPTPLTNGHGPEEMTPKILLFSSADEKGISRITAALSHHYEGLKLPKGHERDEFLNNLAFTLAARRSMLPWRSFSLCFSPQDLVLPPSSISKPLKPLRRPTLAFIFTGQGAQWAQMGKELLGCDVFRHSMEAAESYLQSLGCQWSLIESLLEPAESSRINHPELSQTLCTALQIALVELFLIYGIRPVAVIGHSSGEIAAAYCAGGISRESAWRIAYERGLHASRLLGVGDTGSMISVGVSPERAKELLDSMPPVPGHPLVVACRNSPKNVTISGDKGQVDALAEILDKMKIFHRKLKVNIAYHSPHMERVVQGYSESIQDIEPRRDAGPFAVMISSVTGQRISVAELSRPSYWARNMISTVHFDEAVDKICAHNVRKKLDGSHLNKLQIEICLEIGPHAALASSVRDISNLRNKQMNYLCSLRRRRSALVTFLEAAGQLHCLGLPVDIHRINHGSVARSRLKTLCNLPEYPFDHSKGYMHESRISKGLRLRSQPKLDLLGKPVTDWNHLDAQWRNFLRLSELPWMEDHKVNGTILYPAAGMLVMAIEAIKQLASASGQPIAGYQFRNVKLHTALVIPPTSRGVEVQFTVRQSSDSSNKGVGWSIFRLCSNVKGRWLEICEGLVRVDPGTTLSEVHGEREEHKRREFLQNSCREEASHCTQTTDVRQLYECMERYGLGLGPLFQSITEARYDDTRATGIVRTFQWPDSSEINPRQPHVVHPCTLDGVLQFPLVTHTRGGPLQTKTLVPSFIRRLWVSSSGLAWPQNSSLTVVSKIVTLDSQGLDARITALTEDEADVCARIEGARFAFIAGSGPADETQEAQTLWNLAWQPDLELLSRDQVQDLCAVKSAADEEPVAFFEKLTFLLFAFLSRMQRELSGACSTATPAHLQRYLVWAREKVEEYGEKNVAWTRLALDDDHLESLSREIESANAQGRVYATVGQRLTQILRSEIDILELLFQSDLLTDLYQELSDMPKAFKHLDRYLTAYAHKNPRARYLEVGAGTGGCTGNILKALTSHGSPASATALYTDYTFTDISESFFEKAREKLHGYRNVVVRRLDVETAPESQGFDGEYDVVVAANVLHATKDLGATLKNVFELLRPGGKLILYEITNTEILRNNFTMGLLPGWWLSTEEFRTKGPCISTEKWHQILLKSGFTGVDFEFRDYESHICHELSILVSTKRDDSPAPSVAQEVVIVSNQGSSGQCQLVSELQTCLMAGNMIQSRVVDLAEASQLQTQPGCLFVFTDELYAPVLEALDETAFVQLQQCLSRSDAVLWLTRATGTGEDCSPPSYSLVDGFARVLRVEQLIKFVTVALDYASESRAAWAAAIARIMALTLEAPATGYESAFEERDGMLHVCRLQMAQDASEEIHAATQATMSADVPWGAGPPLRLAIGSPGMLDTLQFVQDDAYSKPLEDDEVEVEVHAVGLNFKDCLIALGSIGGDTLGHECSGVVTRVGPAAPFKEGDRVVMSTVEAFRTYARSKMHCVCKLAPDVSLIEAAALPVQFVTAWQCIHELGRLRQGDSILIHAGAGGTGQAAIQLAKLIGAETFATVGSASKKQLLVAEYGLREDHIFYSRDTSFVDDLKRMTGGRGVDVVLNSLAGESLMASWDCVAPYGRFVEIGKRDILADSGLPMFKFNDNVTFSAFDGAKWVLERPREAQRAIETVMNMQARGLLHTARPLHVYAISDVSKSFRALAEGKLSGKAVLELKRGAVVSATLGREPSVAFDQDKTYVIAGGLGGIGRSIARWLAARGARWLLLFSRSGATSSAAKELVQELESGGVHVSTPACDISNSDALERVLRETGQAFPPIRGCIQASMVLQDELFQRMSFSQWQSALKPKVSGSWNLHRLLPADLDFFVLLSSVSGICGQHGQANYAAANTYLDALAHFRAARGQAAVSIDLGAVLSDGYLAENEAMRQRLMSHGSMLAITRRDMHSLLDHYCDPSRGLPTGVACQVVVGINTRANMAAQGHDEPDWLRQPLFSTMDRTSGAAGGQATGDDVGEARARLGEAASLTEAGAVVAEALVVKLRRSLTTLPDDMDMHTPIHAYGVDSLLAVELRSWIAKHFDADVPIFEMLSGTSFASLGVAVASKTWHGPGRADV